MAALTILNGDATHPQGEGEKHIYITHIVNNVGMWGSGFVVAINKRWGEKPRAEYVQWYMNKGWDQPPCKLGEVQFVDVPNRITIANMVGQHGVQGMDDARPPIRYAALANAMEIVQHEICSLSLKELGEIHCPMFGSGLAGGNKEVILEMMQEIWVDHNINVFAYEFDPTSSIIAQ